MTRDSDDTGSHPRELWLLDDARILGGGQQLALNLAASLDARWSITIFCPATSELAAACADRGIRTRDLKLPDPRPAGARAAPRTLRRLRSLLKRAGDDTVIVCNSARASAWTALAAVTARTRPAVVHLLIEQDTVRRAEARAVLRRFGKLLALGANTASAYRAALPGVSVWQANNFLEPSWFATAGPRPSGGPPSLGALARLIPEKGILELVEELAARPQAWSSLTVAGSRQDERYLRLLKARIADHGLERRIALLGHRSDVAEVLDGVDILVVPSTGREGQPGVVIEALARGRPAVVRRAVWSEDFAGLPVFSFEDAESLEGALARAVGSAVDADLVRRRFGPEQFLDALAEAAAAASAR